MAVMTKFSATFLAALIPLLAACTTPTQQCVLDANAELRKTRNEVKSLTATVDRGYGIRKIPHYVPVRKHCGHGSHRKTCVGHEFRTQEIPYKVDIPALKARLTLLEARLPQIEETAQARAQACTSQG